jgi:L-lactate dehydrogenase (cytochrome)
VENGVDDHTMTTSLRRSMATLRSVIRFQAVETDPVERRLARAANVADLRRIARRRLPRGCFDYIDGAAEDERSMAANADAFAASTFRPRVLRGLTDIDTTTTVLGAPVAYPLVLAPTGFTRIADPQGELAVARSAARAGLPYTLSTLGTRSIEEVRAVSDGRLWFQVYAWRDRSLVEEMITRAAAADYEALVLTVDTAVFGRRERDVRHGFSLPPKIGASTIVDGLLHPGWTWAFVRNEPIMFANVIGRHVGDGSSPVALADYINSQFDPTLSWADVEWLRSVWKERIVIKGIQTVADARIAADVGVDAIALSNHGGRQLDDAPSAFSLVAPVADAVQDRTAIICDGGVRRGSDIVKAVAAGASACMAGRAYLYALAAGGERGVDRLLGWWRDDVRRTMALVGTGSVAALDRSIIDLPRPGR